MNAPFPQTEINIEALENVKTRLFQLQESILFFLRSINPDTTPGNVSWTELHSKFNVLIAKYLHLTNLVNDPHSTLLQSYTVFPNEAPANDQHVQNLSVLLRTKLFPELEQEAEDRIKEGSIEGLNSTGTNQAEDRRIQSAYKLKVAMHDAVCQAADEIFENQRDMVHTKVRYESDDEGLNERDQDGSQGATPTTSSAALLAASKAAAAAASSSPLSSISTTQPSSSRSKQPLTSRLPLDEFPIGKLDGAGSIRYMNDWGGTLNDVEGYSSGSDEDGMGDVDGLAELDDAYFERRRLEPSDQEESSSESEMEYFEEEVQDQESEEEEDQDQEDAFMEVSTESQDGSSSMVMVGDTFDDGEEEDYGEEDMEEVL